jgi:hypothetical protein
VYLGPLFVPGKKSLPKRLRHKRLAKKQASKKKLVYPSILDAFDAIANNTVLEFLTIDSAHDLLFEDAEDCIKIALNPNTFLRNICIDAFGDPKFNSEKSSSWQKEL